MPIYAYRCAACGHAKDVLQKLSDAPLTDCPACGAPRFEKQVTAAGFQLKGSGWYATDFKNGSAPAKPEAKQDGKPDAKPEGTASEAKPANDGSAAPASAPTPAATPAAAPPPPAP
jgi:putative FmdB family regulatory protein